ncbi:acyltransferase family protein [Paenibacillus sp. sgz5001063]|uniref:acyltransferase family protein n=1 Tax=Paenibacillus sp. sgz5001063 TaxID=3242474 RepID=UPI0036D26639
MSKLNYKLISTYRTQLMGLAILWVMLYHSTVDFSSIPVLGTLQAYGYGGVDIFLLVSGLGLYYAYRKNTGTGLFYQRRLQRILPTYLPVVLLFCLLYWVMGEMSLLDVLLNLTTLSFWFGLDGRFDWYVPALLVLYLLTPLFMHFFKVHQKVLVVAAASLIGLLLSVVLSGTPLSYLLIFTIRIPIFFVGVLVGYLIDKQEVISRRNGMVYLGMLLTGAVLLAASQKYMSGYVWSYGLWWYPFILITLPLCLLMAGMLHLVPEYKGSRFRFLSFCGTHSLEIYLIHERMLKITADLRQNLDLQMNDLMLNVISILLTLGLAILLKKAVTVLSTRMKSGTAPVPSAS